MVTADTISRIISRLSDPSYMKEAEERLFRSDQINFDSFDDILLSEDVNDIPFRRRKLWTNIHFGKVKKPYLERFVDDPNDPNNKVILPEKFRSRFFIVNTFNVGKVLPEDIEDSLKSMFSLYKGVEHIEKALKRITKEIFVLAIASNCRMVFFSKKRGRKSMIEIRYEKRLHDYMLSHEAEHETNDDAVVPDVTRERTEEIYQAQAEKFKDADREGIKEKEEFVKRTVSLDYSEFVPEPLNRQKIMKDSGVEEPHYIEKSSSIAKRVIFEAIPNEPEITRDIVGIARGTGAKMYGLAFRLKQPTSLSSKILKDAKSEKKKKSDMYEGQPLPIEVVSKNIYDAVRYTVIFPFERLASGYQIVRRKMKNLGYTEMRCKNFYLQYQKNDTAQKAIQCVFRSEKGQYFELQFHTVTTMGVKEVLHPLYEEWRSDTVSENEKKILDMRMKNLSATLKDPPGIFSIKEFNYLGLKEKDLESVLKKKTPKNFADVGKLGLTRNDKVDIIVPPKDSEKSSEEEGGEG